MDEKKTVMFADLGPSSENAEENVAQQRLLHLMNRPLPYSEHEQVVGNVLLDSAMAVLAASTRAALFSLTSSADPSEDLSGLRLLVLSRFVGHLCQAEPERRILMGKLLRVVAANVEGQDVVRGDA